MANLLLDKGTVYLTWAGTIWEAAEVRRRDWADVPVGAFAWLLDSGEGVDFGSRTLWGGYVLGNKLTARGRGEMFFRPTPARPGDDAEFTFQGDGIARVYVPLRKVASVAVLDLPDPAPKRKGGPRRG